MAGFSERFEVSCSNCGVLGYEGTRLEALVSAQHQKTLHLHCEDIIVFDRMAHKGQYEIYNADGTGRSRRI